MKTIVCQFERPVADAKKALDHAKAETIRRGGTWDGDLKRGSYDMHTPKRRKLMKKCRTPR